MALQGVPAERVTKEVGRASRPAHLWRQGLDFPPEFVTSFL